MSASSWIASYILYDFFSGLMSKLLLSPGCNIVSVGPAPGAFVRGLAGTVESCCAYLLSRGYASPSALTLRKGASTSSEVRRP